jgi:hypothetical protein
MGLASNQFHFGVLLSSSTLCCFLGVGDGRSNSTSVSFFAHPPHSFLGDFTVSEGHRYRSGQWEGPSRGSSTGALCTRFTLVKLRSKVTLVTYKIKKQVESLCPNHWCSFTTRIVANPFTNTQFGIWAHLQP